MLIENYFSYLKEIHECTDDKYPDRLSEFSFSFFKQIFENLICQGVLGLTKSSGLTRPTHKGLNKDLRKKIWITGPILNN